MAHKTFISYKYSESRDLRDKIVNKLGKDAMYYQGETSSSPSMTDNKTSTIRQKLADMIYDTTVMIVIISPNMIQSYWMEWEIKYALREQSRNGYISHSDGVLCVIKRQSNFAERNPYLWAKTQTGHWSASKFFKVLVTNMDNKKSWADSPQCDKSEYDALSSNYIDIVDEDEFLKYPTYYINKAFEKSENIVSYNISK